MPARVEYHVVTTLPPIQGDHSVLCSVDIHDRDGHPLTKLSAIALVESMLLSIVDVTVIIQRRLKQPGAEWFTIRAYRADAKGKMRRAPYPTDWHPRFT
jgi:hypothetical protein